MGQEWHHQGNLGLRPVRCQGIRIRQIDRQKPSFSEEIRTSSDHQFYDDQTQLQQFAPPVTSPLALPQVTQPIVYSATPNPRTPSQAQQVDHRPDDSSDSLQSSPPSPPNQEVTPEVEKSVQDTPLRRSTRIRQSTKIYEPETGKYVKR